MNKILNYILELVYPPVCGFCGKICREYLCKKCEIKIKKYEINLMQKNKNKYFDELFCIFKYEKIIRETLIEYKFQNKPYLYKTFSKIILNNKKVCGFLKKYDIIIPVPISKKRKLTRGYNQSYLIAKEIAKMLNIKLENNILIKTKDIKAQSGLTKKERAINIKNAFMVKNIDKLKNKNILLFDDIYTTGSTVNECARILKEAGANRVGILTIAKDYKK